MRGFPAVDASIIRVRLSQVFTLSPHHTDVPDHISQYLACRERRRCALLA